MIENKKNMLIEHSKKYKSLTQSSLDGDDDSDHFVDFGLVELSERTGESLGDLEWMSRYSLNPTEENLV